MNGEERPLYICIQAIDKSAVDEAIHQINQFIAEHTTGLSPPAQSTSPSAVYPAQSLVPNHPPPPIALVQDKIYINLDHAPPSFNLLQRVVGSAAANISYIASETGVNVTLKGQGYSIDCEEPLHLLLEWVFDVELWLIQSWLITHLVYRHVDSMAVQNARALALSLVGTLQQEFVQWQRGQQQQQQQQKQPQQQQLVYTITHPVYSGWVFYLIKNG